MKTLTKIKLIDWHFFDDQEFEIRNNCVLYGENGCGKSTIIDAIHYVLSGGTCKFNKAANSGKSARTVYTYMKARVGSDTEEYMRSGSNIITHIALEFIDTYTKRPLVVGVVLQITANQQPTNRFYAFKDKQLDDSLFYANEEKTKIRSGKEFFEHCKDSKINIQSLDNYGNSKSCKKNMNVFLEVPESYTSLLEKAISFADLGDIDSFAREFLFEEDQISSGDLEQAAGNYKTIKSQLETEQKKDEALKPIYTASEGYLKAKKDSAIYSYLLAEQELSEKTELLGKAKQNVAELTNQEEQLSEEKGTLEKAKDEAIENLSRLGFSQLEDQLRTMRKEEETNKLLLQEDIKELKEWNSLLLKEKEIASCLDIQFDYEKLFEQKDYQGLQGVVRTLNKSFKGLNNSLIVDRSKAEAAFKETKQSINVVKQQIKDLKNQINDVPALILLQNYVREECLKNGVPEDEISVLPLCDAVEVKDDAWRNAIEGLLGVYRFDLLVPDSQFSYAYRAFIKHQELKDYFGFGIVRQKLLAGKQYTVKEDSIASKLESTSSSAAEYINYLVGKYQMVDGDNFNIERKGINKDGMIFDGVSVRRINPEVAASPYLGRKSYVIRMKKAESELERLLNIFKVQEKDQTDINEKIIWLSKSKIEILTAHKNTFFSESTHLNTYKQKKKQADELAVSDDLLSFERARLFAEEEKKYAVEVYNNCLQKLIKTKEKHAQSENDVDRLKKEVADAKDVCESIANDKQNDFLRTIYLEPYKEKLHDEDLIRLCKVKRDSANGDARTFCNRIIRHMIDYNKNFNQSIDPVIENLEEYLNLFREIHQNELPKRIPEVVKAKDEMERLFREDFASKLIDKISMAKETVKLINHILSKHKFGTDQVTFQFKAEPTNKEEFKAVSKIISEQVDNFMVNQFLMNSLDNKQKEAFESVFQVLIGNKSGESIEKQIHDYCDYRNYLDYDIKEISLDGTSTSYKKNQRSKSGGETQTPFYVMIAAAFNGSISSRSKQNASSCTLAILDEAFNNMDEERITEMLRFYNELDIQLIISVPTNRAGLIIGKMGTQIAIIRQGTMVVPYVSYSPEKEKQHA